jgi:hypothetical protein
MKQNLIIIFILLIFSSAIYAQNENHTDHLSHEGHKHEELINGEKIDVNLHRFDLFIVVLEVAQIAIVSVNGMVCDFCARGIERSFSKDINIKKIDVDLSRGKIFLAYDLLKEINFEEIKKLIIENGQNATDLKIIKL